MAENKDKEKKLPVSSLFVSTLLCVAGTCGIGLIEKLQTDRLIGCLVLLTIALSTLMVIIRAEYQNRNLDYDNNEHITRLLFCFIFGCMISFACVFLPVGAWPFVFVFVMLSLFGNQTIGIYASGILLLIPMMLSKADASVYVLYFVSGVFAVYIFGHLKSDFRVGIPLFLVSLCLIVCETAGIILNLNARPDFELFVIPMTNVIVNLILLIGLLKIFSAVVIYRYRGAYLDINDTEADKLAVLRSENKQEYMNSVHIAYFCERIGNKLGLDSEALKCAGYYHRLGKQLKELLENGYFPPAARDILEEYLQKKDSFIRKETAVLCCSEAVVLSITYLLSNSDKHRIDYDKVIDTVFRKLSEDGKFSHCDISMNDMRIMKMTFKEEKLYYDFLC